MFSKTCEYAIRASIFIASQSHQNKRVTITDIAEKINSPKSFTAKILQILAKNNLVHSVQGIGGGFEIPKEIMSEIKLSQIVTAIDGDSIGKMFRNSSLFSSRKIQGNQERNSCYARQHQSRRTRFGD